MKNNLQNNIFIHNKISKKYEKMHGEIYNDEEQLRLNNDLNNAIKKICTNSINKISIDFGCGAGNLTNHLSDLGCDVIACDVSQGFLDLISSRKYNTNVSTFKLNGTDLFNIPDCSVDMISTYSVLHHLEDYLSIITEFMRVLKPGGIIYIDHENSEEFWINKNNSYAEYNREMKKNMPYNFDKFLILTNYIDWFIRKFINNKYQREGDIHVFEDDHIEWPLIIDKLCSNGAEILYTKKYLLYRRNNNLNIYNKYKNSLNDMQLLVARKL